MTNVFVTMIGVIFHKHVKFIIMMVLTHCYCMTDFNDISKYSHNYVHRNLVKITLGVSCVKKHFV